LIGLNDVAFAFDRKPLFDGLNLRIEPGECFGILGRAGSGKSTLARLLTGALQPQLGTVVRSSRLSWPIGYSALLHSGLSPLANVRNIASAKFQDPDRIVAAAETILGEPLAHRQTISTLSPATRLRVQISMTLAFDFDFFLLDEWPSINDPDFRDRVTARLTTCGLILLTRHAHMIEKICSRAAVLHGGHLTACDVPSQTGDMIDLLEQRDLMDVRLDA